MNYISITNNIVDNFIVADPAAIAGLEAALGCTLIKREDWPTAERGDQYIDGILYRTVDGVLTDIRMITPPEPVPVEPDPIIQRVEALEEAVDTISLELLTGGA